MTVDAWAHRLLNEHGPAAADHVRDCLKQSDGHRDHAMTKFGPELLRILEDLRIQLS